MDNQYYDIHVYFKDGTIQVNRMLSRFDLKILNTLLTYDNIRKIVID
jgi:hypothetical protein